MNILKMLLGLGLATLPDIASGLLVTKIVLNPPSLFHPLYLAGILLSVLADFDVIIHKIFRGKAKGHKMGLHYPIPFLLAVYLVTVKIYPSLWISPVVAITVSLFHFIHDSMGSSGGIQWLWPFTSRKYKIYFLPQTSKGSRLIRISVSKEEDYELIPWLQKFFLAWPINEENLYGILYFIVTLVMVLNL